MAILLSPVLNEQQFDSNGDPLSGGLIYTYLAGTTTPVTTYKTSSGTAHSNPIVLDASGNFTTGTQLWLDSGKTYKFVVQDSTFVTIRTYDDITPINDVNPTPDEWIEYNISSFSYLSGSSFSVVGDQTNIFQIGRRVKTQNTGGVVYGSITGSIYVAPNTTVTIDTDSGVLDAGLSSVSYGLLAVIGQSIPGLVDSSTKFINSSDKTKSLSFDVSQVSSATDRLWTIGNYSGWPSVPATEGSAGDVLVSGGAGSQPAWGAVSPIRQTIISGPVDSSGYSAFGGATGSTAVTASGTIRVTAAGGNSNRTGSISNPSWTGLSTNGTMFLYLDVSASGIVSTGSVTLEPTYRWGGADVTTANQHTFNIQEMTMKVGSGSSATQVYRVFVGEVTVAANVVSAITWYSLYSRYMSVDTAIPGSGVTTSFNHNIGVLFGTNAKIDLVCQTSEKGWTAGEVAQNVLSHYAPSYVTGISAVGVNSRNSASVTTGSGGGRFVIINKTTGNLDSPTAANWKIRVSAERSW